MACFQTVITKIGSERFRLLNVFLWPVPGKNMLQAKAGNFVQDQVMPCNVVFNTDGFQSLREMQKVDMVKVNKGKFSITQGCIRKIPLNPPLHKGEEVGMPRLINKLLIKTQKGTPVKLTQYFTGQAKYTF